MSLRITCATVFVGLSLILFGRPGAAQSFDKSETVQTHAMVLFTENRVEVLRAGSQFWDVAPTNAPYNVLNPGDQLRTLANSRAGLRAPGSQGTFILGELSYFAIPNDAGKKTDFQIIKGRLFNFHRGAPGELRLQTPTVSAIVRGTEFLLRVDDDGGTIINMFNGEVEMSNSAGSITLTNGEEGIATPGQPPVHTAVITSVNLIQWCLYYPAVLNLEDLATTELGDDLQASKQEYRNGDILAALKAFPTERKLTTDAERIYYSALLLSVGNMDIPEYFTARVLAPSSAEPRRNEF